MFLHQTPNSNGFFLRELEYQILLHQPPMFVFSQGVRISDSSSPNSNVCFFSAEDEMKTMITALFGQF